MKGRRAAWGCLAALGLLLARSAEAAQAVRDGLALCAGSVIPALYPYLAESGLLTALDEAYTDKPIEATPVFSKRSNNGGTAYTV